nr:hypothetical protein 34 [bacterium]
MRLDITHTGLSSPAKASTIPYGAVHLTDFLDVWLPYGPAIGIDHLFYENGEVELRVKGRRLSELPRSCPECGETMKYTNETMESGFRGHLCCNDDCPRDV